MKTNILLVLAAFAAAVPAFALPPPRVPYSARTKRNTPVIRLRPLEPERTYSPAPTSGMAAAVAISGAVATGLRMLEEATKKPTVPVIVTTPSSDCEVILPPELQKPSAPPVIVIPEDIGITEVHVVPMKPLIEHPVPITIIPMEIMSAK